LGKASFGARLAARFVLLPVRVQLGLGLAAGGGAASPSVLAQSFLDTQKNRSF